ncbi:UPF0182 family protein [Corynebacterium sp. 49B]|uniref:UPF0182 family protein n=1 Tax=Corynebacterium TaxID=1716 RepID=UPI003519E449
MALSNKRPSSGPPIKRPPKALSWTLGIIIALVVIAPMVVGFYTDWLWFQEVDFTGVFTKVVLSRIALFFVGAILAGGIAFIAGYVTYKNRPDSLEAIDPNNPIHQYRKVLESSLRGVLIGLPVLLGLFSGFALQREWRTVLMFFSRESFGETDPQFGHDLGFYAFVLPMLQLIVSYLSVFLIIAFFIGLIGHYLLGGIRVGNRMTGVRASISTSAQVQLTVTAGLWMLVKVAGYYLERYSLLFSKNETFTGGGYTDINAILPAKILLMVIGIVVAIAFFSAVVLKDLRIPALATGLMVLSAVVIGTAYPLIIEEFSVKPNRAEKEREYIQRNIDSTRYAYNLTDDNVTYMENWGAKGATDEEVANDRATLSNIRLLDPEVLAATFTQQQQLRNFYGFPDTLAIDRYTTDGELRDYVVTVREMDPNALSDNQRDWINRHTVYTHGNGFIAAPANQVDEVARDVGSTRGGYPVYNVSDLQALKQNRNDEEVKKLGIEAKQPRTYYGPVISEVPANVDYSIVGDTGAGPVEYDTDTDRFTYDGKGGVDVGNMFNRAAFALRYQELNLLLSDRVGSDSKIIFNRDPRERVKKVAPWLTTDSKTYPAVVDGRIKWIVDGYTTLANLPYAERTSLTNVTEDARNPEGTNQLLFNDQVSYIRNSVKAVVDAYDGDVQLYAFDEQDPVLKAWSDIFPNTVKPKSEISPEIMDHMRFPEDLFKVQRELMTRYHVDDPGVFFNNDAFWSVPTDPTATETRTSEQAGGNEGRQLAQPPYYVVAADPKTGEPSFQMITSFRGLKREFLSAHMAVSSDPDNYGHITLRVLPTNTQTQGPRQAQDTMISSDQIARDRSLWERTNKVIDGNLLTLPVGGGEILYVEPVYTQRKDQASAFPKLLRVLISYNGKVGYAPTIAEALDQVGIDPKEAADLDEAETVDTGKDDATPEDEKKDEDASAEDKKDDSADTPSGPASGSGDQGEAIDRINRALENLQDARNGSNEEYGRALDELDNAVRDYQENYQN